MKCMVQLQGPKDLMNPNDPAHHGVDNRRCFGPFNQKVVPLLLFLFLFVFLVLKAVATSRSIVTGVRGILLILIVIIVIRTCILLIVVFGAPTLCMPGVQEAAGVQS